MIHNNINVFLLITDFVFFFPKLYFNFQTILYLFFFLFFSWWLYFILKMVKRSWKKWDRIHFLEMLSICKLYDLEIINETLCCYLSEMQRYIYYIFTPYNKLTIGLEFMEKCTTFATCTDRQTHIYSCYIVRICVVQP